MNADADEARDFARAFRSFLEWVHTDEHSGSRHEVVDLLRAHLEQEDQRSVVVRDLPLFQHVNLQVAVDAWSAEDGRSVVVHGLALSPHYNGVSLHQLLHGDAAAGPPVGAGSRRPPVGAGPHHGLPEERAPPGR